MQEITPFIRIALYMVAGWLAGKGLPPQVAEIITNDPAIIAVLSEVLAGIVAGVAVFWWRLAKRFGWST